MEVGSAAVTKSNRMLLAYFFGYSVLRINHALRDRSTLSANEAVLRVVANDGHRMISSKLSLTHYDPDRHCRRPGCNDRKWECYSPFILRAPVGCYHHVRSADCQRAGLGRW